jgi:hypothetical protein
MKNLFLASVTVSLLSCVSSAAVAGSTNAEVEKILLVDQTNLVYVYPKGGVVNPPACHNASDGGDYYSFSIDRTMGKEYLAALLSAQERKVTVRFWGKDECTDQYNAENIRLF